VAGTWADMPAQSKAALWRCVISIKVDVPDSMLQRRAVPQPIHHVRRLALGRDTSQKHAHNTPRHQLQSRATRLSDGPVNQATASGGDSGASLPENSLSRYTSLTLA
jgi:hypothetical protein